MKNIIVKIVGGLGNQMFQYAFAYAIAKKFDAKILLDLSWFEEVKNDENTTTRVFELDAFNIDYRVATKEDLSHVTYQKHQNKIERFLWNVLKIKKYEPTANSVVETSAYNFNKKLVESPDYIYYSGFFQNEKYFKNVRRDLLKSFSSNIELDEKNQFILDEILKTNSVSIHIRRGDYVSLESAKNFHGTCSLEYYKKAIEYIAKKVRNPQFFLFSDDICWAMANLDIDYPLTIVDFNINKGWLDLNLMKNCRHNIVANSSFSWWGAWLNENPEKIIITPKRWIAKKFKKCDIIPKDWTKL